ncbi:DUF4225 domain-containing protein [Pseudomonas sp. Irchel s3b2]|uniref:DUF4225 domain-containing protein n=1 Tax=Pseudomonas sp. Irchel s3b2 TaxID=2009073 RepID=UPI002114C76B|nr:DUF4225 domain-containing protein [Pseudomonas sp. Irchel s3b2]
MKMNETSCDIHDVTNAASDLVAVGCHIGMTHLPDGFTRLRFSSIISAYANEVIQAVDEGVISAWQGFQEIRAEYEELSSKARFYVQNGVGVVAGVMQVKTGVSVMGSSGGLGLVPGGLMVGHGANNIYEGLGNIYHGPGTPGTVGPVRRLYRNFFDDYRGDVAYYSVDLFLSGYGVSRRVLKPGAVELFRRDPINYERAYRQAGKLALAFEALVDALTINVIFSKEESS